MDNLFAVEKASPVNKRTLYKQTKEAQLMERLERRMEGTDRRSHLMLLCACWQPWFPPCLLSSKPADDCTLTACCSLTWL